MRKLQVFCLLVAVAVVSCKKEQAASKKEAPEKAEPSKAAGPANKDAVGDKCPAGSPFKEASFAERFGAGVETTMHCLKKRTQVKMVIQLNRFCRDELVKGEVVKPETCPKDRVFALTQLQHVIDDYKITNGMADRDFEIAAVIHDVGTHLARKSFGETPNPWAEDFKKLQEQGVKFYVCLTAVDNFIKKGVFTQGDLASQLLNKIEYVPNGLTALLDLQEQGYTYIQP